MITLLRDYKEDRTEGRLLLPDGTELCTLELPWKENATDVSCIPEGTYLIDRDTTGKQQWFKVRDVEGRTHIEIHPASKVSQLNGCIAPCSEIVDGIAYKSTASCKILLDWFGDNSWVLSIQEG